MEIIDESLNMHFENEVTKIHGFKRKCKATV